MSSTTVLNHIASLDQSPLKLYSTFREDSTLSNDLMCGKIVEFYGEKKGGKLLVSVLKHGHDANFQYLHSIVASLLLDPARLKQFNVIVFDYGRQFSTNLLVGLINSASTSSVCCTISAFYVMLQNLNVLKLMRHVKIVPVNDAVAFVKQLANMTSGYEAARWNEYMKGAPYKSDVVIIMDIGTLLCSTGHTNEGTYLQDTLFRSLRIFAESGGLVIVLNQVCDDKPMKQALGSHWSNLVRKRIFFGRNNYGHFYTSFLTNSNEDSEV